MDIKKVLVADAVDNACVELLKENGFEVVCKYKLKKDDLIKELQGFDGLIVRSDTKVTADVINSTNKLKVIGRAGVGVDNIDVTAATNKNIIVLNAPAGNSISACELTCTLLLSITRHVPQANISMRDGKWDRKLFMGTEVYGKTLAIVGMGRIGREVGVRMQSFGMKTIGFDPIVSAEEAAKYNIKKMELEELYPLADYITVHTPLIPQTRNMINEKVFSVCKKGVKIINVARGGIIDEMALFKALENGQCGGAALDVYEEEPPKAEITQKLIQHPKVITTPHLGASTAEAQVRVAVEVSEQFIALTGKSKKYTETHGIINRVVLENLKK